MLALVDALTTKRGREGGRVVEQALTQLLVELDGSDPRSGVYVIAIDAALLRLGRFGELMYVPLPSPDERGMILKTLARRYKRIDPNLDLMALAKDSRCDNFSGADLSNLVKPLFLSCC
ncbi:hypothetical protein SASPL_136884 [Salvia splendens]|uniref:Uncharacterized protein n=1 Tax=Salvia splendens TaxID=180675 RepID=A0A8X8X0P0_SALSN|nr:hypothetical protein SASPL_136884 [Salvia splendens]